VTGRRRRRRAAGGALAAVVLVGCQANQSEQPEQRPSPAVVSHQVQSPVGVTAAAGRVWVVSPDGGTVTPFDEQTGRRGSAVHVGQIPLRATFGDGVLWVSVFGADRVVGIDPVHGRVVRTVHVTGQPEGLTWAFGALWVVRQEAQQLTRITSGGTRTVSYRLGVEPRLVAAGSRQLYVANFLDDTVTSVDPRSGRTRTSRALCSGPQGIAVQGQVLWVTCTSGDEVVTVDARTLRRIGSVRVSGEPDAVLVIGTHVDVVATAGPTLNELGGPPAHPVLAQSVALGSAPPLADRANVDAVATAHGIWVTSPQLGRVFVVAS
jgi:hypothetical protein